MGTASIGQSGRTWGRPRTIAQLVQATRHGIGGDLRRRVHLDIIRRYMGAVRATSGSELNFYSEFVPRAPAYLDCKQMCKNIESRWSAFNHRLEGCARTFILESRFFCSSGFCSMDTGSPPPERDVSAIPHNC